MLIYGGSSINTAIDFSTLRNQATLNRLIDDANLTPEQFQLFQQVIAQTIEMTLETRRNKARFVPVPPNFVRSDASEEVSACSADEESFSNSFPLNATVDPIRDKKDVERMAHHLLKRGDRYALRNYLFFRLGVNLGLRGGDIVQLQYMHFMNPDGTLREYLTLKEQKTGKLRRIYLNKAVHEAIAMYAKAHPGYLYTNYLFPSQKGGHISRKSMGEILKPAAQELGIPGNINTHSMRKTWAYHMFMDNQQSPEVLAYIQDMMNHSSSYVTLRYIGITDEKKKKMYLENVL